MDLETFRADRHEAKLENQSIAQSKHSGQEPNTCVQLRSPGAEQLIILHHLVRPQLTHFL